MGILSQVSRIVDLVVTDKGREVLTLMNNQNLSSLITKFAIFDDDINYENVDFSLTPVDPNYPTPFSIEPCKIEKASAFKSKLITVPPGTDAYDKAHPESKDYSNAMRVIEVTPPVANVKFENELMAVVASKNFEKATGGPVFDPDTSYVVYLKDESDAQFVSLAEVVPWGEDPLTPTDDPEPS